MKKALADSSYMVALIDEDHPQHRRVLRWHQRWIYCSPPIPATFVVSLRILRTVFASPEQPQGHPNDEPTRRDPDPRPAARTADALSDAGGGRAVGSPSR